MNRGAANVRWLKKVVEWEAADAQMEAHPASAFNASQASVSALTVNRAAPDAWRGKVANWEISDDARELCAEWWEAISNEVPNVATHGGRIVSAIAVAANRQLRKCHLILEPSIQRPFFADRIFSSTHEVRASAPYKTGRATIFIHQSARPLYAYYRFLIELHTLVFTACERLASAANFETPWHKPLGADLYSQREAWLLCQRHSDLIVNMLSDRNLDGAGAREVLQNIEPPTLGGENQAAFGWGLVDSIIAR